MTIALPAFTDRDSPMHFREWTDPFGESDLEDGPFGPQPLAENGEVQPAMLFVPLVAFTESGERMGQGAAHYDGWLAKHPGVVTIGMAWDMQKVDRSADRAARHSAEGDRYADRGSTAPSPDAARTEPADPARDSRPASRRWRSMRSASMWASQWIGPTAGAGAGAGLSGARDDLAAAAAAVPDLDGNRPLGLKAAHHAPPPPESGPERSEGGGGEGGGGPGPPPLSGASDGT